MQNYPQPPRPGQQRPAPRPQAPYPAQNRPMAQRPAAQRPMAQRPAPQAPRPAVQRPQGNGTFTGSVDMRGPALFAILAAVLLIVGALTQFVWFPGGFFPTYGGRSVSAVAEIASTRGVRINEVMTANRTALSDENGEYPDWIELINTSSSPVDVSGWALLDKSSRKVYFTFPTYQLQPGATTLVYASGRLANQNGSAFHAPFRLSSLGDTLILSDENGTVVESINIPALDANQSYTRTDSGWMVTGEYTPGMANTSLNYALLTSTQPVADSTLLITEVMADNASYPAPDGGLYDWIEIYNAGLTAVDLSGYGLSDSPEKPARWKFPSVSIQPGQYLVVYASGVSLQDAASGMLHANFGLRAEGENAILYNASGQVLSAVSFDNLKTDQSLKRQADGSYAVSTSPTPGAPN